LQKLNRRIKECNGKARLVVTRFAIDLQKLNRRIKECNNITTVPGVNGYVCLAEAE